MSIQHSHLKDPKTVAFDALGNPIRREMIRLIAKEPKTVGELSMVLPISRPAVSKHMKLLQDAKLVTHKSVGTQNLFELDKQGFEDARDWIEEFWDDALTRFKLVAENTK